MRITKILLVIIAFAFTTGICEAGESLDAKLARLKASTSGKQTARKSRDSSTKKSLDERLAELESKYAKSQKDTKVVGSLDTEKTNAADKLELSRQTFEAVSKWNTFPIRPIAINFLDTTGSASHGIWYRETMTNGFWGLNDKLADHGIEIGLGVTNVYQANVRGGDSLSGTSNANSSTNQRQGRFTGAYDLELTADAEKLFGFEGGTFYMHGMGSWSRSDIDTSSISSAFGVNGVAGGRRALDIIELWYEQAMFEETLLFRFGKLDIGGGFECRGCPASFDGSAFANDATSQFLNGALGNNPTIPFPEQGLGAILYWNPIEWWYASAGVIDAQAVAKETGFRTAFHKEDYFFYIAETGVAPRFDSAKGFLQGTYRIGLWYDPQPKINTDREAAGKTKDRDDVGFYTSCDQMLIKENSDDGDTQGLGTFFRYGYAPSKTNDITKFFSFGLQYQGLIEGRDDDVLGLGYAHGSFANTAGATYPEGYESVMELYYNALLTPWFTLSPSIQYVSNPGGIKTAKDAVVFALRAQVTF